MIQGRFGNTTGRPYVNGRLLMPRLSLAANLSFLVDTGADGCVLMPADGITMGINYQALVNLKVVGGVGGNASCFQESAVLAFSEPNRNLIRLYSVIIMISQVSRPLMRTPSIVGRNILDRWRIDYDPSKNSLKFIVRSADHTI